ncbi:hypothetical protein NHQ30_007372 [Ciborinia camelliae]|nr:hypothetical protein NHQ30_007372 [Ciborinia camelliae]
MALRRDKTILLLEAHSSVTNRIAILCSTSTCSLLIASRSGNPPRNLPDVPACKFDWEDATTHANPFAQASNIHTVLLVTGPSSTDKFSAIKEFIDLAIEKGVKRFVLFNRFGFLFGDAPEIGLTHQYLESMMVDYAILRPAMLMGKVPFVSAEDVAHVRFQALIRHDFPMRDIIIQGPELLSHDDVADIISKAAGRTITHIHGSAEELSNSIATSGLSMFIPRLSSQDLAVMMANLQESISRGSQEHLNNVVFEITGEHPMKFVDFAQTYKSMWRQRLIEFRG